MSNIVVVYLAGAIMGCTDGAANDWRHEIIDWFKLYDDVKFNNPMKRDYRGREDEDINEIVMLDKRDILSSNVIVVRYKEPSVGTSMETFFAWTLGKPIIVWADPGVRVSPWLKYHSSCVVENFEQCIDKIIVYGDYNE